MTDWGKSFVPKLKRLKNVNRNDWAILNVEIVELHLLQMTSFEQACVLHIMTISSVLSLQDLSMATNIIALFDFWMFV